MDDASQDVQTDDLFVGLTRPSLIFGIPYGAFVAEFMFVTIVFLAIGNPLYMLLVFPVHVVLYAVSANDPGALDSMFVWLRTFGRSRNTGFWGGASFTPLSLKKWNEK